MKTLALTNTNQVQIFVNWDRVEFYYVDTDNDTRIRLSSGKMIYVKETPEQIDNQIRMTEAQTCQTKS